MDWSSRIKLRAFLGGLCLFLVSGFYSCQEVKYSLWSKKTTAKVTQVKEYEEQHRGETTLKTAVTYEFTDDHGTAREGKDTFVGQVEAQTGQPLEIQYRSGPEGDTRVAGHANTAAVYAFLICLLILVVVSYPFFREVYQEVYAPKKKTTKSR